MSDTIALFTVMCWLFLTISKVRKEFIKIRWFGIINRVDDVNWPPYRVSKLKLRVITIRQSETNEGLSLESSALKLFTVANLRH